MKLNLIKSLKFGFYITISLFTHCINGYFKDKETTYPIVLEDREPEEIGINSFEWSADGNYIAVIYFNNPKICKIFDSFSGKVKLILELEEAISIIAWSPDNKYFAIGLKNGTIEIRNIEKGYEIESTLDCHENIRIICWKPNGNYLCVYAKNPIKTTAVYGRDRTFFDDNQSFVYIFNLVEKKPIIIELEKNITAMQWHPTDNYLAIAQFSKLMIFDIDFQNLDVATEILSFNSKNYISSFLWIPDGQVKLALCTHFSNSIEVYDLCNSNYKQSKFIKNSEIGKYFGQIAFSPDGAYMAATDIAQIEFYSLDTFSKVGDIDLYKNEFILEDQCKYFSEQTPLWASKISWSPNKMFLAVLARAQYTCTEDPHVLIILQVSSLYFSKNKLQGRELTGKLIKTQ